MSEKKEKKMFRFLLFVGAIWLISQIVKLFIRSAAGRSAQQERKRDYDIGKQNPQAPPIEFHDVQDADFKDITKQETK